MVARIIHENWKASKFESIAGGAAQKGLLRSMIADFREEFARSNPNFDRKKFMLACIEGVGI